MDKILLSSSQKKRARTLWYIKRLRTMSGSEILHRAKESLKKRVDKQRKKAYFPDGLINTYPKSILYLPKINDAIEIAEYSIFGHPLSIDDSINWHLDILNHTEFPKDFSFSIDTRTGIHGNVKVVWEINRMQFLSAICLKYHQSQDQQYLDLFMKLIESWKEANPYLEGVNWYSNIEVNIRIINWFVCWEILQVNELVKRNQKFADFVTKIWLPLIELHGKHAARYESRFSSSNNHLIAEASGLFIAGCYWNFEEAAHWRKKGKKILEREIQKQHSSNGINKEEASEYIQFITDFFLVAFIVGNRTGHAFSKAYNNILEQIFEYIYNLMDMSGHVPYYGDDDDGKVLWLNLDSSINNFQSLLTSGAIIFNENRFKLDRIPYDLKNQILFGQKGEELFNDLIVPPKVATTKLYEQEGHFFIKKGSASNEIYLHVDIAPLGYLSIAAHGHADALSFFLHIDGQPYIVDPGTYTYHSYPIWREYFKGTLAHNTVRVDGLNQSVNGGPCLWLDHYSVNVLHAKENQEEIIIKGSHDGYKKLGVSHSRSYIFDKKNDVITILDELQAEDVKDHTYEIPFHLHPKVDLLQLSENEFEISHSEVRSVRIKIDDNLDSKIVKGSENPLLGWFSPSFLQKKPTSVIYTTLKVKGNIKLKTQLSILTKPKGS